MEVSGQLHVQVVFSRGQDQPCPFDMRLVGPQSRSERGGEEKKSLHCPCRELKTGRPARSLVSVLTEVFRLKFVILSG